MATEIENEEFAELEESEAAADAVMEASKGFGQKMAEQTSGIRFLKNQLTTDRSMTKQQVARVADTFGAQHDSVGGRRAIISKKHDLIKPVLSLLLETRRYVEARTIPYPDQGMRLIRLDKVDAMVEEIDKRREQLNVMLADLDAGWQSVKDDAKDRLQELYQEADYPAVPSAAFGIYLSFPAIQPDERLKKLNRDLYDAEAKRIAGKFAAAVDLAESAAAAKLAELIQHFVDRLVPGEDGKQKTIRSSTVENIKEFAEQFQSTTIGSNPELDALVAKVEAMAGGVDVDGIRKDEAKRGGLAVDCTRLLEEMDNLVIAKPIREFDLED